MSSSLIKSPIYSALSQILTKSLVNYYKNLKYLARSGRPKSVDSEEVRKAIEASNTRRVSGEVGISQSGVLRHLH